MLHVTTVIPLGSLPPITVIPMKLNSTINLKWRPLCVLVTCTFLSQSLPACLPLFLSPWRWLNQMTTVAVCHCQKTFQFGGPPTSQGTLPLQKAASPQVAPSEAGLVHAPTTTTPTPLQPAVQQCWWGPRPHWARLSLQSKQDSVKEEREDALLFLRIERCLYSG